jgi:hypothetical protein
MRIKLETNIAIRYLRTSVRVLQAQADARELNRSKVWWTDRLYNIKAYTGPTPGTKVCCRIHTYLHCCYEGPHCYAICCAL